MPPPFEFTFLHVVFLKALGSSPKMCQQAAPLGVGSNKAWALLSHLRVQEPGFGLPTLLQGWLWSWA